MFIVLLSVKNAGCAHMSQVAIFASTLKGFVKKFGLCSGLFVNANCVVDLDFGFGRGRAVTLLRVRLVQRRRRSASFLLFYV